MKKFIFLVLSIIFISCGSKSNNFDLVPLELLEHYPKEKFIFIDLDSFLQEKKIINDVLFDPTEDSRILNPTTIFSKSDEEFYVVDSNNKSLLSFRRLCKT